jgi:hypothetical protein
MLPRESQAKPNDKSQLSVRCLSPMAGRWPVLSGRRAERSSSPTPTTMAASAALKIYQKLK